MAQLTTQEQDLVVNLIETFVLDGGPEQDPIYQDALALVERLRAHERVTVQLTRSEVGDVVAALRQEGEAEWHERGKATRGEALFALADRLRTVLDLSTPSAEHAEGV